MGRAVEPPHLRANKADDERAVPLISMDCGKVKATGASIDAVEGEMGTTLVVKDYTTGMLRAIPMAGKNQADYAAASVVHFVRSLYVGRCRLRCDNEPAIMAVATRVKEKLPDRLLVENSPKYSSSSNGAAERAIRTLNEQLKTMRYDLEGRYGIRITPNSTVWLWMVRHAASSVNRGKKDEEGLSVSGGGKGESLQSQ